MAQLALIIGNGFDLDLGLPSKYSDFMDSPEWRNILSGVRSSYHGEELNHSLIWYLHKGARDLNWFDIEEEIHSIGLFKNKAKNYYFTLCLKMLYLKKSNV